MALGGIEPGVERNFEKTPRRELGQERVTLNSILTRASMTNGIQFVEAVHPPKSPTGLGVLLKSR